MLQAQPEIEFNRQSINSMRSIKQGLLVVVVGLCVASSISFSQHYSTRLQHVQFKDKILATNLGSFARESGAKVVRVQIRKQPDGYLYQLARVYYLDFVEDRLTVNWAQWNNKLILFYDDGALPDVCTITDTATIADLLQYARTLLPKIAVPKRTAPITKDAIPVNLRSVMIDGTEWTFKVANGRELFFNSSTGYDGSDAQVDLPAVPERHN